jgi:myo-inositol-1(or 4)-monophosphatase
VESVEALDLLTETATAIRAALGHLDDWGLAGTRPGQYRSDLTADAAAHGVLDRHDVGVLSEESGLVVHRSGVTVIVDPVDGSTNAAAGIPWFATSLCAVDDRGPLAALVINLATGMRFDAQRGAGARRNGQPIAPTSAAHLRDAIVGVSGLPPRHLGWRQFRALGACALDLCAVACGMVDGFIDCSTDAHGVWDYAGGMMICDEAGAAVGDALGRDLLVLDHGARRTPVAAATSTLFVEVTKARQW